MRPTGIAFGSPMPNIRHRFGGHLRTARVRTCDAVRHAPPLTSADVLGGSRRRTYESTGYVRRLLVPHRDGCRGLRPRIAPGPPDDREYPEEDRMKFAKVGALAAAAVVAFAACSSTGGSAAPSGSAAAGGQPDACKDKKGTSSSEIHVYSSLPRQGSNTEQTNTLVEQIKATLDGQKVGDFTIKYFDLDDSSAANNGDWDGAVEQQNANKAAADPDAMVYIGTYNSGAAKLSIPILNQACLVMISPANTLSGPDQGRRRASPSRVSRTRTTRPATATTPASSRPTTSRVRAGAEWAKSARQDQGVRPRRHPGLRRRPCQVVGAPRQRDRHRSRQPEQDVRRLRREGDRLQRPCPEDQGLRCGHHLHRLHHRPEHRQALEGPPRCDAGHHDHVR